MAVDFDDKDFQNKMEQLAQKAQAAQTKASHDIGEELMRLSSFEVPHDKGLLQASGTVQPTYEDESNAQFITILGYNKVYAHRLHEHPEYHFQKGRKGKYLEDPMKNNLQVFQQYYAQAIQRMLA